MYGCEFLLTLTSVVTMMLLFPGGFAVSSASNGRVLSVECLVCEELLTTLLFTRFLPVP